MRAWLGPLCGSLPEFGTRCSRITVPGARSAPKGHCQPAAGSGGISMAKPMAGLIVAVWLTTTIGAHHSPAAFDRTKQVTLTGIVTSFKWSNPHSWIEMDVANASGGVEKWAVEMTSPTYLVRAGWKSTSVKPGDKITVTVNPVRSGEPTGIFLNAVLPDGRTLTERPARLGEP